MSIRQIGVSLTADERATLKEIADNLGESISSVAGRWIRDAMAEHHYIEKKEQAKGSVFDVLTKTKKRA